MSSDGTSHERMTSSRVRIGTTVVPPALMVVEMIVLCGTAPWLSRLRACILSEPVEPLVRPAPFFVAYHFPVFSIDAQGSCFGSGLPLCNSSIEILSGERI